MEESFGDRLARLRGAAAVSVKQLAHSTGLPYSELLRLEAGAVRRPAPRTLRRLIDFLQTTESYLLSGAPPSPAEIRGGFLRYYDALAEAERQSLRFAPIQARVEAVLHYVERAFPTLFDFERLAGRLGYSPHALSDVLRGAAPVESHLLNRVAAITGLDREFFVRGDFFGGAAPAEPAASAEQLQAYYAVVQAAITAGISPERLRKAVESLALRNRSE